MEQIGRYKIVGELGRGAMGVVYRAEDPAIGRTVAIKTIKLGELTDASEREFMRERLLREARSAGILSHPGIVTIYDIAEEGDTAYVFMEYVNGDTLEKMCSCGEPIGKSRILEILRQTAAALDYAHGKGIVHRDIKPANIMISADGEAKITDFGVAKILSQQMTQTRSILGTPYYMSPEQIQGGKINGRSDQFALGVIAFELITGERPYSADSLPTLLFRIVKELPASPHRFNPTLAPEVDTVLSKAFEKDPERRFSSCIEFVSAFAMAINRKPDWQPLVHGASSDVATVATARPVAPPREETPSAPTAKVTRAEPAKPVETAAPPPEQPAPEPVPMTTARHRREEEEDEPHGSSLGKYIVLAVLLAVVGVAAVIYLPQIIEQASHAGEEDASPAQQVASASPPVAGKVPAMPPPPSPVSGGAAQAPESTLAPGAVEASANGEATSVAPAAAEAQTAETPAPAKPPASPPAKPKPVPQTPVSPKEHWVQIRSNPPGAKVAADKDAQLACTTPCELPLAEGRHVLRITMAGHRMAPRIIRVPDITDLTVNLDQESGTLAVTSTPPGATIYINGEQRPEKTPSMIKLPAGKYGIRIVSPGLPPFNDSVEVRDQVITTIGVDW